MQNLSCSTSMLPFAALVSLDFLGTLADGGGWISRSDRLPPTETDSFLLMTGVDIEGRRGARCLVGAVAVGGAFSQYESKLGLSRRIPHIVVCQVESVNGLKMKVRNTHQNCCVGCTKLSRKLRLRLWLSNQKFALSGYHTPECPVT